MTVRKYSYQDADAPVLDTSAPGGMVNLLRKVLVDGYGSVDQITDPAGWEMMWDSATNQRAAFRSTHLEASGFWLYVDDRNGADTGFAGGNRWARAWGMETFDGWDTNGDPIATGRFPLDTQSAFGVTIYKSRADGSTTQVPWEIVADERAFWMLVDGYMRNHFAGSGQGNGGALHFFGDFTPRGQGITAAFALCGGNSENFAADYYGDFWAVGNFNSSNRPGCYLSYSHDGLTFSKPMGHAVLPTRWVPYPDPVTGALLTSKPQLMEDGNKYVGELPGILAPLHEHSGNESDFPHGLELVIGGKTHRNWRFTDAIDDQGTVWIDVAGPWYGA